MDPFDYFATGLILAWVGVSAYALVLLLGLVL